MNQITPESPVPLKIKQWLDGEISGLRGKGTQLRLIRSVRQYLLKVHNYKCQECGWSKKNYFTGKYPLEVHHIDGNINNTYPKNLQVLCPNCHALTPNFTSLNRINIQKLVKKSLQTDRKRHQNSPETNILKRTLKNIPDEGKICIICGNKLTGHQTKYCTIRCKNKASDNKKIDKYCLCCGTQLKRKQTKFCSNQCQRDHEYSQYIERWLDGKESGARGKDEVSYYIKRYLLEKYNYSCPKCGQNGINPYTENSVLNIHHFDGNRQNNSVKNLGPLCPNCHSLTSNYKGGNP